MEKFQYLDTKTNKPAVILLHGAGSGKESIHEFTDAFSEDYRLISVDLPGHNGVLLTETPTLDFYANFVHDFVLSLKIESYCLVGFSLGGLIALKYSENYPNEGLLGTVVWASPVLGIGKKINPLLKALKLIPQKLYPQEKSSPFYRVVYNTFAKFGIKLSDADIALFSKLKRPDVIKLINFLETVKIGDFSLKFVKSTLFIFGTNDVFVDKNNYGFFKSVSNPNCQSVLIENGGHYGTKEGQTLALEESGRFLKISAG